MFTNKAKLFTLDVRGVIFRTTNPNVKKYFTTKKIPWCTTVCIYKL